MFAAYALPFLIGLAIGTKLKQLKVTCQYLYYKWLAFYMHELKIILMKLSYESYLFVLLISCVIPPFKTNYIAKVDCVDKTPDFKLFLAFFYDAEMNGFQLHNFHRAFGANITWYLSIENKDPIILKGYCTLDLKTNEWITVPFGEFIFPPLEDKK